jgi:hypothetical protein
MNKFQTFVFVALSICISFNGRASISDCKGSYLEIQDCKNKVEIELIEKYSSHLRRSGTTLTLLSHHQFEKDTILENGKGEYGVKYEVRRFYPEHGMSFIYESAHEYWGARLFVHQYGHSIPVPGEIVISVDGKSIVSFNSDIEAGFTENAVAVYMQNPYGPTLLTKFVLQDFGVIGAKFINNSEIELLSEFWDKEMQSYGKGKCTIFYSHKVWQFKNFTCTANIAEVSKR